MNFSTVYSTQTTNNASDINQWSQFSWSLGCFSLQNQQLNLCYVKMETDDYDHQRQSKSIHLFIERSQETSLYLCIQELTITEGTVRVSTCALSTDNKACAITVSAGHMAVQPTLQVGAVQSVCKTSI